MVRAPLLEIPLFAKRGSLLAVGPALQHTDEKPADPIELRVYDGADASFTLYEDDGISSDFSAFTTITFSWSNNKQELTVGARAGRGYSGMLLHRTFNLVRVREGHGVGYGHASSPDKALAYDGMQVVVKLGA